jgi:hypothetical protein
MNVLPKTDRLVIPTDKFTLHCLNPWRQPDKARAFEKSLGYNLTNYQLLIDNIKDNIDKFDAVSKGNYGHGEQYEVVLYLTGPNGKSAFVLTAWIDDTVKGEMRLITAHIDKPKGGARNA